MPSFKDLSGKRFARLVVVERDLTRENLYPTFFFCKCDCDPSKIVSIRAASLTGGKTRSCGCYNLEVCKRDGFRTTKHGKTETPEYAIWQAMKRRCYNPNDTNYERYGGRGIRVCDRWIDSFDSFIADMQERPSLKHSIDRLDNDKDYSPENCLWRTATEQANNRRSNVYLEIWGERKTLAQWARDERCVVSYNTFFRRLSHCAPEKAMTIKNLKKHPPHS
jgi:hypothetical protein